MEHPYQRHWRRFERSHAALMELRTGIPDTSGLGNPSLPSGEWDEFDGEAFTEALARLQRLPEAPHDRVQVFFQDAHHLKDWLRKDPTIELVCDPDAFINAHPELQIAADIANASKHAVLSNQRHPDAFVLGPDVITRHHHADGRWTLQASFRVVAGDRSYDVHELADRVFALWKAFLAESVVPRKS